MPKSILCNVCTYPTDFRKEDTVKCRECGKIICHRCSSFNQRDRACCLELECLLARIDDLEFMLYDYEERP